MKIPNLTANIGVIALSLLLELIKSFISLI